MSAAEKAGKTVGRREVAIPVYIEEGVILRLNMGVLSTDGVLEVSCGAGLGSDHVHMSWKREGYEREATFYMRDVLKAWVSTFDPAGAKRLPTVNVKIDEEE